MVGSTLGLALAMVPALTVTVWRLRRLRHMLPTACASEPPTVSVAQAEEAEKAAAAHVVRLWPRAHSPPRHDGAEPAVSGVIGGGGLSRERVRSAVHLLQAVETTDELRASLGRNASRTPDCTAPLVLVLGSINMDLHAETDGFPGVGSNTKGRFFNSPGGKGANEAVGLAQLGCRSVLIGRLGTDPMGDLLLAQLPAWRVDVSAVVRDPDNSTGVAVIVESAREKHKLTISCQGANSAVGAPELESLRLRLPNASAVVLQLEVCRQSVVAAAQLAAQAGKLVVLKASPCAAAADAPAALLRHVDVLFANDLEAGVLIGAQAPLRVLADGARAAEELRASGIGAVVLTTPVAHIVACSGALDLQLGQLRQLGGGGAEAVAEADAPATNEGAAGGEAHGGRRVRSLSEGGEPLAPPQLNGANGVGGGRARLLVVPMFRVDMGSGSVIGAADAFVAAFVASLVRGMPLETAAVRASAAGSFSTTKQGTWDSMPDCEDLGRFMVERLGLPDLRALQELLSPAASSPSTTASEVRTGLAVPAAPAAELAVLTADVGSLRQEGAAPLRAHRDTFGQSLLHLGAMSANEEVVVELLLRQVSLTCLDAFGCTPLDRAHEMAILARHAPGVVACRALILAAAVLQVMMCGEQWNCLRDLGVERTASVGEGGTSPSPSPFPSTLLASQPAKGAAVSLGEGASPSSPSSLLGPQPRPSAVGGGGSSGGSMYPSGWLSAMSRLHTWEALCGRKDHASNDLRDGGRGKWTRAAVAAAAAARKRNVAAGGAAEVASSRRGSRGGGGSAHRLAWPRSERDVCASSAAALVFSLLANDSRQCQRLGAMFANAALGCLARHAEAAGEKKGDRGGLRRQATEPQLKLARPGGLAAPGGAPAPKRLSSLPTHDSSDSGDKARPLADAASNGSSGSLGLIDGTLAEPVDEAGGAALGQELLKFQSADEGGQTLLHLAARRGELELLRALKKLGADTHARAANRQTALHVAAQAQQEGCCVDLMRWSPGLLEMRDQAGLRAQDLCPERLWASMQRLAATARLPSVTVGIRLRYVLHPPPADASDEGRRAGATRRTLVRLATDKKTGDTVALKYFCSAEERDHERDVLQLVGPLVAPRVIDCFDDDFGVAEETGCGPLEFVLVMEAADTKQSLAEFIACSAPAGSRARCELMLAATAKRILSLVNAVHALGVVHLDIKPAHFMRFRGYWKLIDFGASCVVGSPCARPAYSEGYCAPEVAALIASGGASCDWAELAGGLGVGVGAGAGAGAGVGLHLPVRLGSGGSGGSSGAVGGVPSSGSLGGRALTLGPEVDVFSCGLVLFELFAGRRFFNPSTEPWPPRLDLGREPTLQRTASCARVGAAGCLLSDATVRWRCATWLHAQEQCLRIVLPMLRTHPPARPPLVELLNKHLFRPAEDTVQRRQIEVLALFSSPVRLRDRRAQGAIPHLKLMRELMHLQQGIPEGQRVIRPAARFPESLSIPLREHLPRVVQFSGHASPDRAHAVGGHGGGADGVVGGTLLFELEDGTAQVPPPEELVKLLEHQPRLQCIFLNACCSASLARRIVIALPHLRVICWTTLVDDRAATAFSTGFYDYLGSMLRERPGADGAAGARGADTIERAFRAASDAFAREGFVFGDPQPWLERKIAVPPVAGQYAMVSSDNVGAADVSFGANFGHQSAGPPLPTAQVSTPTLPQPLAARALASSVSV